MARQDIDIGVEGNDGTGDSIRESFRKTNENFSELYAVFGEGGQISFSTLSDTPDTLLPNTLPLINSEGTFVNLVELASNSALDENANDTVVFDYSVDGKLVLSTGFTQLSDDQSPILGGPLNVGNNAVANVDIGEQAVSEYNARHNADISIDDLVITKGFADRRYITTGLPIRVADEPESTDQFILEIDDYVNGNLQIFSHGIDRAANGSEFIFNARFDDPTNLESGDTVFIRFVNSDEIAVFEDRNDAEIIDDNTALGQKIFVSGTIEDDDSHNLTDAAFDETLPGNFLADVALPRKSVVRRQGDEMEGGLFLSDHPGDLSGFGTVNGADDLQAATKFYVDNTSFSSTENLFVSTSGDDRMLGVPRGREGTALDFAYRTINAAAQRANEIITASVPEPGPYIQTVTTDNGEVDSTVTVAEIVSPTAQQTRKLIDLNKEYLVEEYFGYLNFEYPDFIFNRDQWETDILRILDAISFDINRGLTANTLTRQSAEEFYATTAGRFKIQSETEQVVDSITFVKDAVDTLLSNRLYRQRDVDSIEVSNSRARVTTSTNHGLTSGEQVFFKDMGGMVEIEEQTAYVRVITDTEFELYEDKSLESLWDISDYTPYTTGGRIGVVYQDRVQDFESIKVLQEFDQPDAGGAEQSAVDSKFQLVLDIIELGIDAGPDIVFGSNYKIVLDNGNQTFVDQANPNNLDMIPGKIIVGKTSGARGRIVSVTNNDGTENNNDTFELIQLNGKDFEVGETVEYGNFVKNKQITIFVESGIYEEDLPIKLSNNVSLKGDEFRRVIIRPRKRVSQSTWADMYFYRDLEFDDIPILEKRHSDVTAVGQGSSQTITVDDTSWMEVGTPVRFVGETLFASELEKNTTYYVQNVDQSSLEIQVSETENGTPISFTSASGTMYITDAAISPFLNQINQVQGYFGRFYLENPYADKNVGIAPTNEGNYETAANILQRNRAFIQEEIITYVNSSISTANSTNDTGSIWFNFTFDSDKWLKDIGNTIDAISEDLLKGSAEFSLEVQGEYYNKTISGEEDQTEDYLEKIKDYTSDLLIGTTPTQDGSIEPDTSLGSADSDTPALVDNLLDLIKFAFNENYNPPKRNDADGVDVFMMADATIVRNVTVQSHGGFMVVLDPEGQILTKSPYIQTGSSFSKSDNEKRFRGGMYVDAFVGNIPARITNVQSPFVLDLESDTGQGLFIRPPELPAPFYLDGIRYQVNAISNYDSGQGTVTIFLDSGSNPDGSGVGQGYQGSTPQEIFIQTAGNRSMLGNDFTQINDLGYGLVTNNGAFSEMVSMFTYYCQAAYYANNGSEIRSLNGSNGYGNFGLVAEGADPNEIPDQVTLADPMVQSCKAYTTSEFTNSEEDPFITVYDLKTPPTTDSIITIDHGSVGIFNYRVTSVQNLSDTDNDGEIGEGPDDEVASGETFSNVVYRLSLRGDDAVTDDFFGTLQATVSSDTLIEFRNVRQQIFADVRNQEDLETRPSTAINFDESDEVTYRSLEFSVDNALTQPLEDDEILSLLELDYDFIQLEVDLDNIGNGFGQNTGDTKIAIEPIPNQNRVDRLTRDIAGRQPGDAGYEGGMIFTFKGKTHQVVGYDDSGSFAFIDIDDVAGTNISSYSGTGLSTGIPNRERTLFAGLPEGSTAEITISISLLRATGHDFTQIGTGGFNDSNYPNVIFGRPENDFAEAYTDAPSATSAQIWERRKGRVFFVSTDQNGFFRVGKFFSVDQATGDIEFAGDIGLTGANALGFTRGVTVNEFSADDSLSDLSNQAVPTERAVGGYINRVLGYNVQSNSQIDPSPDGNRIGPGFVALNGTNSMEGDLNLGANQITNLALPGTDGSAAANKNYVDGRAKAYDELNDLRNIEINDSDANDIIVGTGKKRIFVTPATGGNFAVGDTIGTSGGGKTGDIVDIENYTDDIEGNLQIITYDETSQDSFVSGETLFDQPGETIQSTIVDGPVDEFANASESSNSVINVTVTRDDNGAEYDFQIQDDSITNADVKSDASILQSKLNMQEADTFDEDDSTTGWNGSSTKTQSDLGLAKFSDENFETLDGYVRLRANGVVFAEMNQIDQYQVFARTASGIGDASAIDFSDVVKFGNGLEDEDFDNTVISGDTNFPGEALVKLDDGEYGVTAISTGTGADTIARRDTDGKLDAAGIKVGNFDILTLSTTTIRFDTPGGARVFSAVGNNDSTLVTTFPGNIDVGATARTNQSDFQSASSLANEGWIASDWIYTSFIEAGSESGNDSTGIGLGANTGFASAGEDVIDLITGGSERLIVENSGVTVANDLTVDGGVVFENSLNVNGDTELGNASSDTVTFTASVDSNILPDQNGVRNIGSNGTRWDVMYANIFNGVATEAKYADLAEKYTADSNYEAGTVVIFGGDAEVTVTTSKGDRRVAGVVSTNPAYLMNKDLKDNAVAIALQGRVPCKVLGRVNKGDLLVTSAIEGYAIVNNDPKVGTVIGKALENKTDDTKGVIEIVVGRT